MLDLFEITGNLPRIQQIVTLSDAKRIRVCPPKSGCLYPNLSEIENNTETDTEYTVDSTEPATVTLEENTTENESITEAEYYVQVKHIMMQENNAINE